MCVVERRYRSSAALQSPRSPRPSAPTRALWPPRTSKHGERGDRVVGCCSVVFFFGGGRGLDQHPSTSPTDTPRARNGAVVVVLLTLGANPATHRAHRRPNAPVAPPRFTRLRALPVPPAWHSTRQRIRRSPCCIRCILCTGMRDRRHQRRRRRSQAHRRSEECQRCRQMCTWTTCVGSRCSSGSSSKRSYKRSSVRCSSSSRPWPTRSKTNTFSRRSRSKNTGSGSGKKSRHSSSCESCRSISNC